MKCKHCGSQIPEGNKFCEECGKQIGIEKSSYVKYIIIGSIIVGIIVLIFVLVPLFKKPDIPVSKTEVKTEINKSVYVEEKKEIVQEKSNILLQSFPGILSASDTLESEKSIPNIFIVENSVNDNQKSTNIFTLSNSEFAGLDKATLKFIPYCGNVNELSTLDIFVNDAKLFSSVPVCDNTYKQSIAKNLLKEGANNVIFRSNKGTYSVEQIKIVLELSKIRTYFFEINGDVFKQIRDGNEDAVLSIKFVDDAKLKRIKLDINGHIESIETDKSAFSKSINSKISEGNNFVRLEPFEDLEVVELRISLE